MKLLKFLNCDAPHVNPDVLQVSLEDHQISVKLNHNGTRNNSEHVAKSWHLVSSSSSMDGCYWLLNDDNTPIGPISEVLLATRDNITNGGGKVPNGVEETHVDGVDLRSKMGKQLQRAREEYGQTFKTAAKNAAVLMDADRLRSKREERTQLERKRVVEAIENAEDPSRKIRVRTEKNDENNSSSVKASTRSAKRQ